MIINYIKDFRRLLEIISKKRKNLFFISLFLILISTLLEILTIVLIVPFLSIVSGEATKEVYFFSFLNYIQISFGKNLFFQISCFLVLIIGLSMIFRILTIFIQYKLSAIISSEISLKVLNKSMKMPFQWHIKTNTSITKGYLTKDIDNLSEYIKGLIMIVINLILILGISSYLIFIYPLEMIILFSIVGCFYLLIFIFIKSGLFRDGKNYSSKYKESLKIVEEILNNIDFIKISKTFEYFKNQFKSTNFEFRNLGANINIKSQSPRYLIESSVLISIIFISIIINYGKNNINSELALIGSLGLGIYKILNPMQQFFNGISTVQAYTPSFKNIYNLLNSNSYIIPKKDFLFIPEKNNYLNFSEVYFRYFNEKNYSLKNINLKIFKGEKIGIIGFSGSGKSTLIKLFTGLFFPSRGSIFFKSQDIFANNLSLLNWQENISYVPQDIFLSDNQIIQNICFGIKEESYNFNRVIRSAKISEIHNFIKSLSDGYNHVIGEKGSQLSGGQKQRIGIARALYKKHEILILDEALSSLDSKNEIKIVNNIFDNFKRNLLIIVSHRITSLRLCDRIIVINKGIIDDIGSYEELELRNKIFNNLLNSSNSN